MSADLDAPVPYWPALYPQVRAEAAEAVQYWPTPAAEALPAEPVASRDDMDREYNHGAETAYQLTAHSAAGGRDAGYIEARHLELTGPQADQDQWTPAERRWAQGYAAGAESSVSLLRERDAADAAEHDLEAGG